MNPQPAPPSGPNPNLRFLEEVNMKTAGVSRLDMCIQCGTCGGSCPSAKDMDHTPRRLFAMIRAGMRDEALRSNTPWNCVSCYYCVIRCPQNVHITDIMYTLKGMAIRAKLYQDSTAPDFSLTFIDMVENYGRSFELGLATRHYLKHFPMTRVMEIAPMSLGMISKARIKATPKRIEGVEELQAILAKAKELEAMP